MALLDVVATAVTTNSNCDDQLARQMLEHWSLITEKNDNALPSELLNDDEGDETMTWSQTVAACRRRLSTSKGQNKSDLMVKKT